MIFTSKKHNSSHLYQLLIYLINFKCKYLLENTTSLLRRKYIQFGSYCSMKDLKELILKPMISCSIEFGSQFFILIKCIFTISLIYENLYSSLCFRKILTTKMSFVYFN